MSIGTIILVPGFGGNELLMPLLGTRAVLWLNYLRFGVWWQRLSLPDTWGITPGSALRDYYWPLIDRLQRYGWVVVTAPLDWRGTQELDAITLHSLILSTYKQFQESVYLLGHSRGGLVMREALAKLNDGGQAALVRRSVAMGTPHRGSLAACTLLGCFNPTKVLIGNLLDSSRLGVFGAGTIRRDVSAMIASWPSTYELLPAPGHNWLSPDQYLQVYAGGSYGTVPFQQPLADAAKANWPTVPEVNPPTEWLDIQGTGQETPVGLVGLDLSDPASYRWDTTGDGTVAAGSLLDWTAPRFTLRESHDRLPQNGFAIDAAHTYFLTGEVVPSPIY